MKKYFCNCGKQLSRKHHLKCSECYLKQMRGKNHPNFKHGKYIENFCINCNKEISPEAIRCKSCSHKGNLNSNFKGKKHYCIDCKKEISPNSKRCKKCAKQGELHSQFGKKNLGARKRMKENNPSKKLENRIKISKRMSGKNSPFFINGKGYEPYTKDFTNSLKELIRIRDNYQCQGEDCSMTEEEHIIVYGRVLEIHHIDHNKENCDKDNLITLCKQCNIRANSNIEYWQEFYKIKTKEIKNGRL